MDENLTIYLHFTSIVEEGSWETDFSRFFRMVLKQVWGADPKVVSNFSIENANICDPETSNEFINSEIVIIILNNSNSKLSDNQIELANRIVSQIGKDKQSNIFITQRFNKSGDDLPQILQKYPLYYFFEQNPKTQEIIDFTHELTAEKEKQYLLKLTDLAYDVKACFDKKDLDSAELTRNKTIYLAEVSADQIKNRDRLRRSLLLSGYRILPENSLVSSENYEIDVKKNMDLCILSIHIMGELYGNAPSGSDYSFQELQNRCFRDVWQAQGKDKHMVTPIRRIIWLPPQLEPFEEKQTQYLKRINREINNSENTELVQSTLSDLKILIDLSIKSLSKKSVESNTTDTDKILVIADDYSDTSSTTIKETFNRKDIKFCFLKTISNNQIYSHSELMKSLSKFHTYLIINTKSDYIWDTGIISLIARSKGYEGSFENSSINLFHHGPTKKLDNHTSLPVEMIVYNRSDFEDKLELFISKVKL